MKSLWASLCLALILLTSFGCGGSSSTHKPIVAVVLKTGLSIRFVDVSNGLNLGAAIPLDNNIRNIAYNDLNDTLYGMGLDLNLYTINMTTGHCTLVSPAPMALSSENGGMAFQPGTNTILFVNQSGDYYKINATNGTVTSQETDANISVFGLSYNSADGKFYAYSQGDTIHNANDLPTSGVFALVGALGIDLSGSLGLSIDPSGDFGYVICQDGLYKVNLTTGAGSAVDVSQTGSDLVVFGEE